MAHEPRPPSRGSSSVRPMNQESMPGPVAMAAHTSSGVAWISSFSSISNSRGISLLLVGGAGDGGVQGDDDAVVAAAGRRLVVVAGHQAGDRVGQLLGERG